MDNPTNGAPAMTPTSIITPEVRAAIERLRKVQSGSMVDAYPDVSTDMASSLFFGDINIMARTMLQLFPPSMPLPVEMFKLESLSGGFSEHHAREMLKVFRDGGPIVRGLFIPLERLEAT